MPLIRVAPSAISGNNAWGMVPSSWRVPGDLDNHGRYHFYFPLSILVHPDDDHPNPISASRYPQRPSTQTLRRSGGLSLGSLSTGLADDRPHGRVWGLRPSEPRSDDAWSPGSETRLSWLSSGLSVLPSFNPVCSYIGGRTSCVQRECFPGPASSTGGRFSPRQRLTHSTERFDPRSSASIRGAFLPDSRMLVGLALAAGEGRASGAVLGVGGAAGGGGRHWVNYLRLTELVMNRVILIPRQSPSFHSGGGHALSFRPIMSTIPCCGTAWDVIMGESAEGTITTTTVPRGIGRSSMIPLDRGCPSHSPIFRA